MKCFLTSFWHLGLLSLAKCPRVLLLLQSKVNRDSKWTVVNPLYILKSSIKSALLRLDVIKRSQNFPNLTHQALFDPRRKRSSTGGPSWNMPQTLPSYQVKSQDSEYDQDRQCTRLWQYSFRILLTPWLKVLYVFGCSSEWRLQSCGERPKWWAAIEKPGKLAVNNRHITLLSVVCLKCLALGCIAQTTEETLITDQAGWRDPHYWPGRLPVLRLLPSRHTYWTWHPVSVEDRPALCFHDVTWRRHMIRCGRHRHRPLSETE